MAYNSTYTGAEVDAAIAKITAKSGDLIDGSGNLNKIAKFSATNTITDSIVTDTGTTVTVAGDVGIGGISPVKNLHIASDATGQTKADIPGIRIENSDTDVLINNVVGEIEFFTKDSSDPDEITGYVKHIAENGGTDYALTFGTKEGTLSSAQERLRITSDGDVGINTTPGYKLDVNGTGHFVGALVCDHWVSVGNDLKVLGTIHETTDTGNLVLRGGNTGGASIELYGPTHATTSIRNNAYYNANEHVFTGSLTANGLDLRSQISSLRSHANVSGGGIMTFTSGGYFKWSSRFIVMSNGSGNTFSTNGYFDINCPTSGTTITGVGGASNKTVTSDGIPLSTWEALYYILPIGSDNATVDANFRVCKYTSNIEIPANWLLLAIRNVDTPIDQLHVINRYQLGAGGYSIYAGDGLYAGRGNISDGTHTTGSQGYFPGFYNRTYGHEIEAASDGSTLHIARQGGSTVNIGADAIDASTHRTVVSFLNTNSATSGSATPVGSISITTTSTAFNTSSDYRLKENVVSITDGIDRLKQLNPSRFNFKIEPDVTVDGFLAHEVSNIVPESISGIKDGMKDEEYEVSPAVYDDDGELISERVMGTRSVPDYQGIDQSKLVPLLTAALQEAVAKIEALEARVAVLEG